MFCKFRMHNWAVFKELSLSSEHGWFMGPFIPAFRVCKRCGKHQNQDKHLLGVNPVEYSIIWEDIK